MGSDYWFIMTAMSVPITATEQGKDLPPLSRETQEEKRPIDTKQSGHTINTVYPLCYAPILQ